MRKNVVGIVIVLLIIGGAQVFSRVVTLEEGAVDTGDGRSFLLEEIEVDAELRRDGVLVVEEDVTYDFDGTFNVGTRSFESGPWEIR